MRTVRWEPLPAEVMGAARDLATQLRLLVDRAGLPLRQLAADDDVPHTVPELRRFFSGRVLPPRELVEVIADRCGGDRRLLLSTLDRAVVAREAGLPWAAAETAPASPRSSASPTSSTSPSSKPPESRRSRRLLRRRRGPVIAAFAGLVVGTNALTAVAVIRFADRPPAERADAASRSAPPGTPGSQSPSSGPASSRAPAPGLTAAPAAPSVRPPSRGFPPAPPETQGNLIRNGAFAGTTTSWWPVSSVRISPDAGRLRADVAGGGRQPWDRIVSAASFPLLSGRAYVLTFDAAADAEIADRVTVELDSPPYTQALNRRIALTTSMARFSYRFTANVTADQVALNFELGGHPGDHTIWLDNVSLLPA